MAVKPIDFNTPPKKPKWFMKPIVWGGIPFVKGFRHIEYKKINCDNLKWPYLIISTHASFMDFIINAKLTFPHNSSYIASLEELIGREWLMRNVGCYPKRKFTKDTTVVKHSLHVLRDQKNGLTIFPEARYSIAGINERIDGSLGKFAKLAGVPVVVLLMHGNFLYQPHWDQAHKRDNIHQVEVKCIVTKDEIGKLSADEIQKRIEETFVFDEYRWQQENHIRIKSKYRAHNIHNILYKCPHCNTEYQMDSKETKLWCKECGAQYEMDEYGSLHCLNKETIFSLPSDWYRFERKEVEKEIENGTYKFEDDVRIEHLENSHIGYKKIGHIHFCHDLEGIHLHGDLDDGTRFDFDNAPINTPSLHIDFNFKKRGTQKRGQAIDINTIKDTWFIFPDTPNKVLTKLQFAVEILYEKAFEKQKKQI